MPSFDIISEVNSHELTNAVDQANRELTTRFDFKGVDAKFALDDNVISQSAPSDNNTRNHNTMACTLSRCASMRTVMALAA